MTQREPSAVQALYGHLKSGSREIVQRRHEPGSVASAMFPSLVPQSMPQPKLQPPTPVNRWRQVWAEANARAWGRR
jgi:hypothetical protein